MSKFPKAILLASLTCFVAGGALAGKLGVGREALPEEIKSWDIDVRPDGTGLPVGKGSVEEGEQIFSEQCAACHGDFGEGVDNWPVLAGGQDTITSAEPVKTVGSYWPYLSTVYDYIHRAMPFGNAQSLSPDQVYAVVAYILNLNNIVDSDFVLSNENFTSVKMPNEANFFMDDRPDTPSIADKKPCMENCKTDVKITKHATIVDVTPDGGGGDTPGVRVD